ncbi:multidrug transporter [Sphingorhabdus soli]|uniref:Multidrug transporter n=1 Tax=Flavisphingopyxis soli TaxID=2601267 RepID=A0A5C6U420_9SPHN|nr:multidrug transporter [Sphingorhabdus soli]
MPNAKVPKQTSHRSSRSGRFVTERYAKGHPSTTERERIKHPERK